MKQTFSVRRIEISREIWHPGLKPSILCSVQQSSSFPRHFPTFSASLVTSKQLYSAGWWKANA
jgi:hypothetical protein